MRRNTYLGAVAAVASTFLGLAAADPSIEVAYCASINTASTSANSSTYQSEGLCYNFCNDQDYALGVLQDNDCWCSNYVPDSDDQVDTSECDTSCPGYPDDYCGGDGLYGYISLSAAVSGTAGGSSTTSKTTSTSSSASETATEVVTQQQTVTATVQDTVITTSDDKTISSTLLTSTKATTTSESDPKTHKSTSTESATTAETTSTKGKNRGGDPTTITSVQTVTSEGTVIIQTVTSVSEAGSGSSNSGLSKGAVAGLVIGILAAIAAFVAGAILFRRYKRNQQQAEGTTPLAGAMAAHRRGSSAGIMSKTGTISSSGYGLGMEEDMGYGSPKRMSMKPLDPRLDPKQTFGLYRTASHDSFNTIRDDQDYSRRVHEPPRILRVTNSDPADHN